MRISSCPTSRRSSRPHHKKEEPGIDERGRETGPSFLGGLPPMSVASGPRGSRRRSRCRGRSPSSVGRHTSPSPHRASGPVWRRTLRCPKPPLVARRASTSGHRCQGRARAVDPHLMISLTPAHGVFTVPLPQTVRRSGRAGKRPRRYRVCGVGGQGPLGRSPRGEIATRWPTSACAHSRPDRDHDERSLVCSGACPAADPTTSAVIADDRGDGERRMIPPLGGGG